MVPKFELVTEAPESAFCQRRCSISLPSEKALAREIEAEQNLQPGDVRVEYSRENGQRKVRVYSLVVRVIDCSKAMSWMQDVKQCLKTKQGFDILNATNADLMQLDLILRPFAEWFHWVDRVESTPRRRVRLISAS
jgi:hypothetical protein